MILVRSMDKNYEINENVECEVTGITDYGVFVKLKNDYNGLIHISEISSKFVNNIKDLYVIGDKIDAVIIGIDNENKQVDLSIKSLEKNNKKNSVIKETGKGFEPLKANLDKWIEEKLLEMEKNGKK